MLYFYKKKKEIFFIRQSWVQLKANEPGPPKDLGFQLCEDNFHISPILYKSRNNKISVAIC
jgi:hypothetical protein